MSRTPPAPLLVLGSVVSVQVGQAVGKQAFGLLEPAGVVTLRLGLAALVLLAVLRPRLPADARARVPRRESVAYIGGSRFLLSVRARRPRIGHTRAARRCAQREAGPSRYVAGSRRGTLGLIVAFGTAIAGMNLIYPAVQHLPLGVATSLQLLGPLTVALAGSRRPRDVAWALLASAGVLLISGWAGGGPLPVAGVLLALGSGTAMGGYLLLSRRAGTAAPGTLALAVAWAAVVSLPFGISASGADLLRPPVLAVGLLVAVLSAVLPYSLDLAALRRLPPRTVGVLESLEPVVGALAGLLLLAEVLDARQWVAVACITAASAGAVATTRRSLRDHPERPGKDARPDLGTINRP